jgi:hypothetical protein
MILKRQRSRELPKMFIGGTIDLPSLRSFDKTPQGEACLACSGGSAIRQVAIRPL